MSVTNAPEWRELVANQQALTERVADLETLVRYATVCKPGDYLVLHLPATTTPEQAAAARAQVMHVLPGLGGVLVVAGAERVYASGTFKEYEPERPIIPTTAFVYPPPRNERRCDL